MSAVFTPDQAAALLAAARAAPSIHNTQPWRITVDGTAVTVRSAPAPVLPAIDPDGRQAVISCGAAVLNLRLAMAELGWAARTSLCPDPGDPGHLTTVAGGEPGGPDAAERRLLSVIQLRHTNRGPYRPVAVPGVLLRALAEAAAREQAVLRPVTPAQRDHVAELIIRAIDAQAGMPEVAREFSHLVIGGPEPAVGTPLRSWLRAPYPLPALAGRDHLDTAERAEVASLVRASTLFVLCSPADGTADRLRAGQALQRVLLTAAAAGIAVSFLNQPVEVTPLRAELAAATGGGHPQLLLRVGYAATPAIHTGRRPVTTEPADPADPAVRVPPG